MRHRVTDPHAAPGWYPEEGSSGLLRWWDGSGWSEMVRPAPPRRGRLGIPLRARHRLWMGVVPLALALAASLWLAGVSRWY